MKNQVEAEKEKREKIEKELDQVRIQLYQAKEATSHYKSLMTTDPNTVRDELLLSCFYSSMPYVFISFRMGFQLLLQALNPQSLGTRKRTNQIIERKKAEHISE